MTVHKHAEMIKAKADNMDLVVFVKKFPHWEMDDRLPPSAQDIKERWFLATDFQWEEDAKYFLCLPQHKEACFHWLNGGDVEFQLAPDWFAYSPEYNERYVWSAGVVFMDETYYLRVKPRKEKRWIAKMKGKNLLASNGLYKSITEASSVCGDCEFYEIEIEI